MSNDENTSDKPTEEPKDAAPPKQRKIVRRSGTTRDNPAFSEAPVADEGGTSAPTEAAGEASSAPAHPAGAPAAREGQAGPTGEPGDAARPRARATFDARAPRPRPGDARPARPSRPPRGGGGMGGDYRPPPARPVGARPIPGRSPAPAGG